MISPKEISEKRFEKAARGYRIDEVDTFLKEVAFSVAKIIKSYDESEAKIHKLVDKVNEYRDDEDAIKVAILGAQKQGRQIIVDAEMEAERMVAEAKGKSDKLLENIQDSYIDEQNKLENLKKEVTAFKAQLTELYNRQLHLIMEIPEFNEEVSDELPEQAEEPEDDFNLDVDLDINEPLSESIETTDEESLLSTDAIPDFKEDNYSSPKKFGDLRFGNNQIK